MIIPVYNALLVPAANMYFQTERIKKLAGRDPEENEKVVFLVQKEKKDRQQLSEDDFQPIGVTGVVTEVNSQGYVEIHTEERVHIDEVHINMDHTIEATLSRLSEVEDLDLNEVSGHLNELKDGVKELIDRYQWGQAYSQFFNQLTTIEEMAGAVAPWVNCSAEDKYAVIATDSKKERFDRLEKILFEYLEIAKVTTDAQSASENDYRKLYREQAIRKQMEYLQRELDEMHPENVTDLRKMEMKIEDAGLNEEAYQEAKKVLNRLKQEGEHGSEYGMLYDYLDFLTSLSWKKEPFEKIDLEEARETLEADHFGLKKVKNRIIQQVAVMNLNQKQSGSILLFVGAPGTGKTSIGQSIAKALHRKYVRVSLGGVRDEADIRGHRRTYIGAMPGRIMDGIQKAGVSNPVMVLDEVDKLSSSYNGDPASALLEVLDPEQNSTFTDHYMNVPYDLSNVLFVCTANSLDTIPEPLLNRMEVINFQGYTATDKFQIARKHLIPKAMKEMGIPEGKLNIPDDVLQTIISDYTMEGGVRGLKKRIDTLCRVAAVRYEEKNRKSKITVKKKELRDYLDMHPIHHDHVLKKKQAGIVTGLAWTQAGGEILMIETLFTKGTGQVKVTGQLGDVMKESVSIALSLVKAKFPEKAQYFKTHDLHIHVPEGAVPKDGPSAGITMTTALSSLVSGHAVDPTIAMTGEVALRGAVLPIGGLPEKLMAAVRAGVKTVFIPKDNIDDLDEVADEVKEQLTIIPVERVDDVLKQTGIL